jgi:hypothetical protein
MNEEKNVMKRKEGRRIKKNTLFHKHKLKTTKWLLLVFLHRDLLRKMHVAAAAVCC